jgi:predicted methyltransferase
MSRSTYLMPIRVALLSSLAMLLGAAASPPSDALRQAIASPQRDAAQVQRDSARHPAEVLSFIGVRPTSTVVEIWPGTHAYWTPILAPYLHDHGTYYLALGDAAGSGAERAFATPPTVVAGDPAIRRAPFDTVRITQFSAAHPDPAPAGSADFVLTFRNLHNWMGDGDTSQLLAAIHTALKPGGILGIEDHRARPDTPQDQKAADGYVRQDYAIALIEKAGFRLVAKSEIERNPRDTTHWPQGVWTLPPSYALKDVDRAKYTAVGEADNFLLTFRKVG